MSKPEPLAVAVTRVVAAPPATLYALVSDIPLMSRYSPETVATKWLAGADSPAVGSRFKGTNAIGRLRWSTKPAVSSAEPDRRFAFKVPGKSGPQWTYQFEPVPGGTLVTESMHQQQPSPWIIRAMQRRAGVTDRAEHLKQGMTTTLDRLAEAAVAQAER